MEQVAFESYLDPTTAQLAKRSAIDQLDYVSKYYKPLTGKLNSLSDAYMAVLAGKYSDAVTASDKYVLWSTGSVAYKQNKGLDINGDGRITKAEATKMVMDRRDLYGKK